MLVAREHQELMTGRGEIAEHPGRGPRSLGVEIH